MKNRKSKEKSKEKGNEPKILFSFQKKHKNYMRRWGSTDNVAELNRTNPNLATNHVTLMSRYEIYAKDMYQQYMS